MMRDLGEGFFGGGRVGENFSFLTRTEIRFTLCRVSDSLCKEKIAWKKRKKGRSELNFRGFTAIQTEPLWYFSGKKFFSVKFLPFFLDLILRQPKGNPK